MASAAGLSPQDPAYAGQREYTRGFLRIYDPVVLGMYCRLVWRCPTALLRQHYAEHVSMRHLDVGPGTGYFLQRLPPNADLTLVDPNPNVLVYAARRLQACSPTVLEADVCKPLPLDGRFDSVAVNLVLHCLPAACKEAAVRHVASLVAADGVLFGVSVLGDPEVHTPLSRAALAALNRRGTFDNLGDTEMSLREALERHFQAVDLRVHGAVAIFTATGPCRVD